MTRTLEIYSNSGFKQAGQFFHGINVALYTVIIFTVFTTWPCFFKIIYIFDNINTILFTVTSIYNIQKIARNSPKHGNKMTIERNLGSKKREIKLISKNVWDNRKQNLLERRNWLIHHVILQWYCCLRTCFIRKYTFRYCCDENGGRLHQSLLDNP